MKNKDYKLDIVKDLISNIAHLNSIRDYKLQLCRIRSSEGLRLTLSANGFPAFVSRYRTFSNQLIDVAGYVKGTLNNEEVWQMSQDHENHE